MRGTLSRHDSSGAEIWHFTYSAGLSSFYSMRILPNEDLLVFYNENTLTRHTSSDGAITVFKDLGMVTIWFVTSFNDFYLVAGKTVSPNSLPRWVVFDSSNNPVL